MSQTMECGLDDHSKEGNLRLDVTVQLYSGRPNPGWSVFGREAVRLAYALRHVLPIRKALEMQPKLGYQGLDVSIFDCKGVEEYEVFGGNVMNKGRRFSDQERSIELALLKSGVNRIEQETLNDIISEVSSISAD